LFHVGIDLFGGNRPHPDLAMPENWSSRRGGNWRHHCDVAVADYARATCRVAA
jgi:hypothetical protein